MHNVPGFNVNSADQQTADDALVVMVVEDEFWIRVEIAEQLRNAGYRVLECSCADEAMDLFQAGVSVHVLFTDVRMPGVMDGWDLAQWYAARFPGLPVLITSAEKPPEQSLVPFFPKPYMPRLLTQ